MQYFIRIKDQEIPVTETVYRLYCRGDRKERYFRESDYHNKVFYYDALDTEEMNGCELMEDRSGKTVEEEVELRLETERLQKAFACLEEPEQDLIRRIYYYGRSLREISREDGIPATTLHYRHRKILGKLKKLLNFEKYSNICSFWRIIIVTLQKQKDSY